MLTKSIFPIPAKQKGLVSCPDPFGNNFFGTNQILLSRVREIVQSGVVEFYMNLAGDNIAEDRCIALAFSEIKTVKELEKIKHGFEYERLAAFWDNEIQSCYETNCTEDRAEAVKLEEEKKRSWSWARKS